MARKRKADWMEEAEDLSKVPAAAPYMGGLTYNPDEEFEKLGNAQVLSPVIDFNRRVSEGKARVAEAWLFVGRFDKRGKLMESSVAKRLGVEASQTVYVGSHSEFMEATAISRAEFQGLGLKSHRAQEAKRKIEAGINRLREAKMIEGEFDTDSLTGPYDSGQYTEYAPTYAGPFNKQLYQHDYLTMHARAFEAKNHNPLAKRIIDLLAQYALGRRFKVRIKDEAKKEAWETFERENKIIHRLSKYWIKEYLTYGELMIDKAVWLSTDPSTVLDIITDPDDISKVYYYHQSYPTAYQTFTGLAVPGAPAGAKKAKTMEYIIRQIPAKQMIHIKMNVVSQEKRGRTILFPVLGWLKRIRDLYNAAVLKKQVESCFIFDDKITGSAADVNAHAALYATIPRPMSVFVHNESIERKPMGSGVAGSGASDQTADDIIGLIATAIGIPKPFFNVMSAGSSSRVGGLVGAEPFEKVIEDLQADVEHLLLEIAEEVIEDAGLSYEPGDVEFIFPSVTKDTTTETLKNVAAAETMGWFDHQMASEMAAAELNVTGYDYKEAQDARKKYQEENPNPGMLPPSGRLGPDGNPLDAAEEDPSPKKGDGKRQLKADMGRL